MKIKTRVKVGAQSVTVGAAPNEFCRAGCPPPIVPPITVIR
jgi:hypothetical protein